MTCFAVRYAECVSSYALAYTVGRSSSDRESMTSWCRCSGGRYALHYLLCPRLPASSPVKLDLSLTSKAPGAYHPLSTLYMRLYAVVPRVRPPTGTVSID